jgi:hypothetical protein
LVLCVPACRQPLLLLLLICRRRRPLLLLQWCVRRVGWRLLLGLLLLLLLGPPALWELLWRSRLLRRPLHCLLLLLLACSHTGLHAGQQLALPLLLLLLLLPGR